jgi:GNAT superfamily N-acetyltransferase
MGIEIHEVGPRILERYGEVSIAYRVETVLEVEEVDGGFGGLRLRETPLAEPYDKDYDEPEPPTRWKKRLDHGEWGFLEARDGGRVVGRAIVVCRDPGLHVLDYRNDLVDLWDLRVRPEERGRGIGTRLFEHAVAWGLERDCVQLKVETQNVNVPACRFYARMGCRLAGIQRHAYAAEPAVAHEVRLLWMLELHDRHS